MNAISPAHGFSADPSTHASSALEKVLEHRFIAELSSALWLHGITDFEVLRSEVDSHGYDLVVEANGITRHIQLKAMRLGGKRSDVALNRRLSAKPSGCAVWMIYDPKSLAIDHFLWLGGAPGKPLPALDGKVARHTKGDGQGHKAERPRHRVVRKSAFRRVPDIAQLANVLFGAHACALVAAAAAAPSGPLARSGRVRRNCSDGQPLFPFHLRPDARC